MTWQLTIDLTDPDSGGSGESGEDAPIFSRIARAIAHDITRGRLRPGQRLPGSRALASSLGVNRNTVLAAINELVAQGWLDTQPAKGTFVRPLGPRDQRARPASRGLAPRPGMPSRPTFGLPRQRGGRGDGLRWTAGAGGIPDYQAEPETLGDTLLMAGGVPDPRLFPGELLARAYRRAMRRHAHIVLDYGDPRGYPPLRAALADMLATTRGLACGPDDVVVTRGSQMAMWLVARVLLQPGDRVAVESYGYIPAWDALRQNGAELVAIPVDGEGMDIAALERQLETGPLRAVYVTPHHQYPTLATMSAARRMHLLALAREHGFAIIEDDYDNEYHYEGRPVLPLASADRAGSVVYIGTLSKVLAPGLRIGYVVAPAAVLERLTRERTIIDRQGDRPTEAAVAELIDDGEIQRHIRRTRRIYHGRRDALAHALRETLGGLVRFQIPRGGMAFWVEFDHAVDVERWAARARERGVIVTPGSMVSFHGHGSGHGSGHDRQGDPHVRMGYARVDEEQIARAVTLMRESLPATVRRRLDDPGG